MTFASPPLFDDGDELVDEHLHAVGIEAEQPGCGLQPLDVAVVIGAEDVDGAIEAAGKLVEHVRDIGGVVEVAPVSRADERRRSLSSPYAVVRAHSVPSASYVSIPSSAANLCRDLDLAHPRVDVDPQVLQFGADGRCHELDRIALTGRDLLHVGAAVAVLGRLSPRLRASTDSRKRSI